MSDSEAGGTEGSTTYSLDEDNQLQPDDTLVQEDVDDALDRGYSPADAPRGVEAFGTTAREQSGHETIEMRIRQEEPDPYTAYGAPDHESGRDEQDDWDGADEPDSLAAEDDWIGDQEVGDRRAGRLVAGDEGSHEDTEKDLVAEDVGIDGAAASAEEAAVHVISEPDHGG
ncbi:DUF5709 domain-containing protein [Intrasporangium sp.]|uniref:DUF5709 domain-containing protein n=1 Tax=Intrasporangium sp. TaxID=1925024 RepID=UPI003221BA4B